ncbi:sugar phosphate isomerase/epimerase [Roseibium porphyridii]|uniref:Sugar phosphate isomerase/epimerase n=1 Tax=Roseibium porphyridii TaxID=2866279 RepID=A0ABY8F5Y7_9HYPH|nr:sugar phosphate isomerase/epimerase family protein [Roseibium sp. KMA01]WFE89859.1 sugar phosphate isomerase/epimerase [Roseibium sp. KMA01]
MAFKNSILLGTIGRYNDRFHVYQKHRSLEERLELALKIPRTDGVEPVYPQDLGHNGDSVGLVKSSGLGVSAVNVNVKTEDMYRKGSFTSRDKRVRDTAIEYLKTAMDMSAELGANMISVCPLIDGWDYPFEVDYQDQWKWLVEAFEAAAVHRDDVRISIEYKAFESKNRIILPTMARSLVLCEKIGAPNLGVTMDVGHALMANETPAAEAALGQDLNRLFYVHFNDNDRGADWDMLPASVNLWETLELLYYIERMGWNGWFAYDVFTRNGDNVEAIAATFEIMENLENLREKISMQELDAMVADGVPARNINKLIASLL